MSEDDILATHLVTKDGGSLGDIFALGLPGFTTSQAMAITDSNAMTAFCSNMRSNFANFLTSSDAAAARHAVLLRRTAYYTFPKLRDSQGCEGAADANLAKSLNPNFEFPIPDPRLSQDNRGNFVDTRAKKLAPVLASASVDQLDSLVSDPSKFTFLLSNDVRTLFPDPPSGKAWGGIVGTTAIDQFIQAGSLRSGCWTALPNQNLRNLVGMVLSRKTGTSSAILVEYDTDYPAPGSDATDMAKIKKISFLSPSTIASIADLPNWPDDACPLT